MDRRSAGRREKERRRPFARRGRPGWLPARRPGRDCRDRRRDCCKWGAEVTVAAGGHVSDAGGQRLTQVRTVAEPRCWPGSVAGPGLAVFAAVVQEPEDAEVAAAAEREQRHLDGEEGSRSGSAGELDRGALPVLDDTVEELA